MTETFAVNKINYKGQERGWVEDEKKILFKFCRQLLIQDF